MMGYLVEKMPVSLRSLIDFLTHLAVVVFCYYIIKGGLRLIPIQGRNLRLPSGFQAVITPPGDRLLDRADRLHPLPLHRKNPYSSAKGRTLIWNSEP